MRLKPHRNYTILGELADSVGWKHKELLERLESKRKVEAEAFFQKKKARAELRKKAEAEADLSAVSAVLEASGY